MNIKFISWASGYRTYIACAVGAGMGIAQYFGFHIPDWALWVAGAGGMAGLRAAVAKQTLASAVDIGQLARLLLENLTVPPTPDVNADSTKTPVVIGKVDVSDLRPIK